MYVVESSRSTDEPIMLLDNVIGFDPDDPGGYIDGATFQRELLELDNSGYKCIKIYINSPGGNVVDGYNICNAILNSKTPVDTYNIGMAASMAGIIWMTGRKRVMADYATFMIHSPSGGADQKMLKALRQSTITILSAKCKMTNEEISYVMERETWFTSSECLDKGFCTEVQATNTSNQKRMPLASLKAIWKEAKLIQNNIFNTDHMADNTAPQNKVLGVSLVASYLGLSVDASESSVLTEVRQRIANEVSAKTKAEDEASASRKALDKMKADLDEMTNKYNAMVSAAVAAEAQAKKDKESADAVAATAAKESLKVVAKAAIEIYATAGRIKKEEVDGWVEDALVLGIDKVKARIEALPINKTATAAAAATAKVGEGVSGVVDPNVVPANAMFYQAKILAAQKARAKATV